MIRKIGLFVLFTCVTSLSLCGQSFYRDSLEAKLEVVSNPMDRFEILDRILLNDVGFQATNVDSARCLQLLEIAQKLNNDSLLATSYNWIGSYFSSNKGDNATGLEYFYKALPFAQKANDLRRVSSLYFDIAFAYFDLLNPQAAFINTLKGGKNLPDPSHPLYHFMLIQYQMNMGNYYATIGNLDSTLFYADKIEVTNAKEKSVVMKYNSLVFRATAETGFGHIEKAEMVFKEAMALENHVQRNQSRLYFYKKYIEFLITTGRIEDALTLSHTALKLGLRTDNNPIQLVGAGYLRRINETQGRLDSAYYYARLEATINDLIYSQTNTNKIQAMAFNEDLRVIEDRNREITYQSKLRQYGLLVGLFMILLIAIILYRGNRQKQAVNVRLGKTLEDLKSTQSQLIQSEKMASLGELTAGIAHEIQNPLNFVNNFSEVSNEMIKEIQDERRKTQDESDITEEDELLNDIAGNLEKILHHGKRAGDIVKGMLQHSRVGSGQKEPTDINALVDEYLRLAYHGLRAKDKSFNATINTEFDESLEKMNIIPQDIGRVILNLITNAFYAVNDKNDVTLSLSKGNHYEPTVSLSTKKQGDKVLIAVKDNGNGIPEQVRDKIFQPFFTTKPTGQGTGLGLSLSYDIVKAHGGELRVETKEGEGTEFIIQLPVV